MSEAATQAVIQTDSPEANMDQQVREYLSQQPEFFSRHSDLLPSAIQASGRILSLEAGQLNQLRKENSRILQHVDEITDRIRRNDAIYHAFHSIQKQLLALVGKNDPGQIIITMCKTLEKAFDIHRVTLTLRDDEAVPGIFKSLLQQQSEFSELRERLFFIATEPFVEVVGNGVDAVIRVGQEGGDRTPFFGSQSGEILSDALIPLFSTPIELMEKNALVPIPLGTLNLGGNQPNRFLPGYSTDLVQDMTDIFGQILFLCHKQG
uniref:DUF484 family protein n=1 Tax=Magnetococcus massalia (strain MO-1) TaxID=451514 RepID=A0A1S7LKZ0_MAGMO|nr:Conserved protein of unknown function [Candidatus Magnetococcus massalia]